MESHYPALRLVSHEDSICCWRGPLQPYRFEYEIDIKYRAPLIIENVTVFDIQPRVNVVQPLLERHADYDEGPIPHIYANRREPLLPFLCLFDPTVPEWTSSDLIADTTVPWTERWLLNYEFWLATGVWRGGGKHVSNADFCDVDEHDKAA